MPQVITSMKNAGRAPLVSTSLAHIADQVDAQAVEPAGLLAQQDLGADAVAAGRQQRVAEARREQAREPADPADDALDVRRGHRALDPLDHLVPRLQADAGGGVGQRLVAHPAAAGAGSGSNRSFDSRISSGMWVG